MKRALEQVAGLVHAETGILVRESQYPALRAAIARAVDGADAVTFLRSAADPLAGRESLTRLIEEVSVGETFFFRDRDQLESIDWRSLLANAGGGSIRAWSAACSTGEEAYSLALLASEDFRPAPPPVQILATDISGAALDAARAGRYGRRAVREVDPMLRDRYFSAEDSAHVVADGLRRHVRFARHNLVRDPVPPAGEAPFDLIVCRNVLIYFDAETITRVLEQLERALSPGGMLVLGVADTLCRTKSKLADLADVRARRKPARRKPRARTPGPEKRSAARSPEPAPAASSDEHVIAALQAADAGRSAEGLAEAVAAVAADPLDPDAHFVRGLLELDAGRPEEAIVSLRRALYVDPTFGLAAFKLARAYEAAGDTAAARRSYEQALRTLDHEHDRHEPILGQVDLADVAAACRARLGALR